MSSRLVRTGAGMCLLLLFVLIASFVLTRPGLAAGAIYYVAPTGNDANPGTEAQPWRTIQKAANSVNPGDTVFVRGGSYNEVVLLTRSGTADNYITFQNYPGETPIIDGAGKSSSDYWNGLFAIRGVSTANRTQYIKVIGLRVQNSGSNAGFGISCYYCANVEIRNNKTYNTYRSGIVVGYSESVIVDGNDVERANNGGEQENISILRESSFVQVTNNVVHDNGNDANGGEAIDIKQGAHDILVRGNTVYNNSKFGIYIDAWDKHTYNILVERNRIYTVGKGGVAIGSECGGLLENVIFTNNLIYGNTRHGFVIGIWGDVFSQCGSPAPTPGNINGIKIVNNTIVGNGQVGIIYMRDAGVPVHPNFGNIYIANNIIYDNGHKPGSPYGAGNYAGCTISHNGNSEVAGFFTITNNLLQGPAGYPDCDWGTTTEMRGVNVTTGNPQFVGSGDYHLTAASPAIDTGVMDNAPGDDFDGNPRPVNGFWDLGAYEFQSGGAPTATPTATLPAPTATSLPTATPSPFPPTPTPTALPMTPTNTPVPPTPTDTPAPPTPTNTPAPPTATATNTPSAAWQRFFLDDFESAFSGWSPSGAVTWYNGAPKFGAYSVRMAGNGAWMQRTISTVGHANIVVRVAMGAEAFEASEAFKLFWWNGSKWVALKAISNGAPEEDGQLHLLDFALPATAANQANFKLAFNLQNSDANDFGYIDNVEVWGLP